MIAISSRAPFASIGNLTQTVEGGISGALWVSNMWSSGWGLYDLCQVYGAEHPEAEKCAKITAAVKTALVSLSSLAGSTGHLAYWAHEVKVFSLGQYAPFARALGCVGSLLVNLLEGGYGIYSIYIEQQALTNETLPAEQEKHRERICLQLLNVIKCVAMVAWATLGTATYVTGLVVSSVLMTSLLGLSMIFGVAMHLYERQLKGKTGLCPAM